METDAVSPMNMEWAMVPHPLFVPPLRDEGFGSDWQLDDESYRVTGVQLPITPCFGAAGIHSSVGNGLDNVTSYAEMAEIESWIVDPSQEMPPVITPLTKEELHRSLHLHLDVACKKFGVNKNKFNKIRKQFGVSRWPGRQLRSIDRVIQTAKEQGLTDDADGVKSAYINRMSIIERPGTTLDKSTIVFRAKIDQLLYAQKRKERLILRLQSGQ